MPRAAGSTAFRIASLYGLSFAAASLLLGAVTWSFANRSLRAALDDRLRGELTALLRADAREGRAALVDDIVARDAVPGEGGYLLLDRAGHRIAGDVETTPPSPGLTDVAVRVADGAVLPGRAAATRLSSGETLAVIGETRSLERTERTLLLISGAGLALMVAIGVGGGFLIGQAIRRRLAAVDGAARAIIDGDLSRRMPVERDDEFGRLSATLNRMLDHIGQLMDSLRHVSDDIAHDLRSPLSRLRATLEATAETGGVGELCDGVRAALEQVDGVIALFGTILRISEVERGGVRGHFTLFRLDLLAAEVVESYAPAAEDGGRTILPALERAATVLGDRGLVGQALVNLVENALRHTPPGTRITVGVGVGTGSSRPQLWVADDGPGVRREDHADILRRFGRGDVSRTTAGHGLGLTLVAAIAAAHGAELVLDDAAPGLVVTLTFPREG